MSLPCQGGARGSGARHLPAAFLSRSRRSPELSVLQGCPIPLTSSMSAFPPCSRCSFEGTSSGGMGEQPLRFPHCLSPSLPLGSVGRDGSQVSILPASPACLLRSASPHCRHTHTQVSAYTPRTMGHAHTCCLF